jgi:hypothetical protein
MTEATTDLERRVRAHEQVLQALIAYMVETDPKVLERMKAAFTRPVRLVQADGYTDTAAYAAAFVRAVIRLGHDDNAPADASLVSRWDDLWPTVGEANLAHENHPVQFTVQRRDDLWEVLRDGRLVGGFVSHKGALDAALIAMQEVFSAGGSAELIARHAVFPPNVS